VTTARALSSRFSSIILFATVAAVPFPFGSTDRIVIAFWCIVLGFGVIAASPQSLRREHFPLIVLAGIIILAYAFVLHEQLAERPWIGAPHAVWGEAASVLGMPLEPSVSIARNQPFFALGATLANILAIVCSFIICIDRDRARQLFLVIAWSGAAYAAYGIAMYFFDPTHLLWREKIAYADVLTSTFVNRNTAATYFGSCAILWMLLLSQQIRRRFTLGHIYWRGLARQLLTEMPRQIALSFTMLLLCLVATLMTNSRAGIVLSLVALVITFATYFHRELPRRGGLVATLAIGALVALLVLQVLGGNVIGRFDLQGLSDEGRLETYRSTLRMIANSPWLGSGLGTFAWAFPAYRSPNISMWGIWDRAHSTPLELASDLGLPIAALVIVGWLIILGVLIRGVRTRQRDVILPLGALTVAVLGLAHSSIDFSLQIPGYSIVVFSLVGAGLAQSFSSNNKKKSHVDLEKEPVIRPST
jgi:O-antigen ligase